MGTINFRLTNPPVSATKWALTWTDGTILYMDSPSVKNLTETFTIRNVPLGGFWNVAILLADGTSISNNVWAPLTAVEGATYVIDGTTWEVTPLLVRITSVVYLDPRQGGSWQYSVPAYYVVGETFLADVVVKNDALGPKTLIFDWVFTPPIGGVITVSSTPAVLQSGQQVAYNYPHVLDVAGAWSVAYVVKVDE